MSVRPIDIMMVPQMNEVSHIKQSENMRPATEQMNIVTNVDKKVENKSEQVTKKDDVENNNHKFDAKEKSNNEYEGSGSGTYSKRTFKEGNVTVKEDTDVIFDIKV